MAHLSFLSVFFLNTMFYCLNLSFYFCKKFFQIVYFKDVFYNFLFFFNQKHLFYLSLFNFNYYYNDFRRKGAESVISPPLTPSSRVPWRRWDLRPAAFHHLHLLLLLLLLLHHLLRLVNHSLVRSISRQGIKIYIFPLLHLEWIC